MMRRVFSKRYSRELPRAIPIIAVPAAGAVILGAIAITVTVASRPIASHLLAHLGGNDDAIRAFVVLAVEIMKPLFNGYEAFAIHV